MPLARTSGWPPSRRSGALARREDGKPDDTAAKDGRRYGAVAPKRLHRQGTQPASLPRMQAPVTAPAIWRRWVRNTRWLAALLLSLLLRYGVTQLWAADPAFPKQVLQTVTNVSQLYRLSESGQRAIYSLRLEGMVCAANPANGGLILRDDSGAVYVEMNFQGQSASTRTANRPGRKRHDGENETDFRQEGAAGGQ